MTDLHGPRFATFSEARSLPDTQEGRAAGRAGIPRRAVVNVGGETPVSRPCGGTEIPPPVPMPLKAAAQLYAGIARAYDYRPAYERPERVEEEQADEE